MEEIFIQILFTCADNRQNMISGPISNGPGFLNVEKKSEN